MVPKRVNFGLCLLRGINTSSISLYGVHHVAVVLSFLGYGSKGVVALVHNVSIILV